MKSINSVSGATSVRRVRYMVLLAWLFAAICSAPQLYVWTTIEVSTGWTQCSTIWEIATFKHHSSKSFEQLQMIYELMHQAFVFWLPSLMLFFSYLLIVVRLLHYTFHSPINARKQRRRSTTSLPLSPRLKFTPLITSIKIFDISSSYRDFKRSRTVMKINDNGLLLRRTQTLPIWRRQLRSRVFLISLTVIAAHIALWLPYNIISTSRFISFEFFTWASEHGGRFLEDLIIVNSLINPIIYGCSV
uniref:G_PROTEIN_RECEP_F1_2 domain-containing protein n=1 Tax=Ascaris lumbricoides TaxID=6252 RepID=A0A0M3HRB0_ASCLU